ncbi:F-box protein SKIP31 [Coccomyxa sp. Obi]|nr:F-box protein SKIP31 [Coccomyxa sp. Obi]
MNNSAENVSLSVDEQEALDLDEELLLALESEEREVSHSAVGPTLKAQGSDDDVGPRSKRQRCSSPPGQSPGAILNAGVVSQAAPGESSHAEQAPSFQGVLGTVPPEMLFRILSFLSAEDLTSTAQACRYLRSATSSGVLWRRLFLARWGPIRDELDTVKEWERPPTWKERYMERDALELQEVCGSVSELMRPFYAQMTAAKRSISLGLNHPEDLPLVNAQYAGRVVTWRRARGLPISAPEHHTCQGRCRYIELGKWVFVCEQCGWAHLCGDACTERVMDSSSDFMPVCPISGRAFPRMMTWVEEEMDMRDKQGDEGAYDYQEDFSTAGRLARAYVAGYNCTNEEELRQVCGVAL